MSSKDMDENISSNRDPGFDLLSEYRPITVDEACDLRILLFGNTTKSFCSGWTQQGFKFRRRPPLYVMTQNVAGPCGVLAAIQAHVIYELLFGDFPLAPEPLKPSDGQRNSALGRALASTLWQAGQCKAVTVAKKCDEIMLKESETTTLLAADGILEYVKLKKIATLQHLILYLNQHIKDFTQKGGCVLYLISIILTHGVENIHKEMDDPKSHLIGDDGYTSQEVVNLILVGKAVANVFDGEVECSFGGEETVLQKGIPGRNDIGLLSLYDYEGTDTVGSYYKDPLYPVWLLFAKSHFTVLFGTSREILSQTDEVFRLTHIDCLSKKYPVTCFKIDPLATEKETEKTKSLSLEVRCIYTRWPLADIEEIQVETSEEPGS